MSNVKITDCTNNVKVTQKEEAKRKVSVNMNIEDISLWFEHVVRTQDKIMT